MKENFAGNSRTVHGDVLCSCSDSEVFFRAFTHSIKFVPKTLHDDSAYHGKNAFCNLFDCTKNGYSLQNSIGERIRPPAMLIIFGYLAFASL